MNRRKALKYFSIVGGTAMFSPIILKLVSSCSNIESLELKFLSKSQFNIIEDISQTIIPKTDTVGAIDLNITSFTDNCLFYLEDYYSQNTFKKGFKTFIKHFEDSYSVKINQGTQLNFITCIDELFSISEEKLERILELEKYEKIKSKNQELGMYYMYYFLIKIRYYCVLGFCTSKEVMVNLMDYNSISGAYKEEISILNRTF